MSWWNDAGEVRRGNVVITGITPKTGIIVVILGRPKAGLKAGLKAGQRPALRPAYYYHYVIRVPY